MSSHEERRLIMLIQLRLPLKVGRYLLPLHHLLITSHPRSNDLSNSSYIHGYDMVVSLWARRPAAASKIACFFGGISYHPLFLYQNWCSFFCLPISQSIAREFFVGLDRGHIWSCYRSFCMHISCFALLTLACARFLGTIRRGL